MEKRKRDIAGLIRSVYLNEEQLEVLVTTTKKQAALTGKKIKSGEALSIAKKTIISDDFIGKMSASFESLSSDDINRLTEFYQSEPMKKFFNVCKDFSDPFFKIIYELLSE